MTAKPPAPKSAELRWLVPPRRSSLAARAAARRFGLSHPLVAQVLLERGLVADGDLAAYLSPDLTRLEDPMGLGNMEPAIRVIDEAIRSGRRICVYGDYDVDGTTGAALLVSYLRSRGADATSFIPLRKAGYGLSKEAILGITIHPSELIAKLTGELEHLVPASPEAKVLRGRLATAESQIADWRKPELLLTVDCGTSSRIEADYARELGMEIVVTDHHEPSPGKETSGIVVNPHRRGDTYLNKGLAGVGVAYKLVAAHFGRHPTANLDLVALGTVADVMPLYTHTDREGRRHEAAENRILVRAGLERLGHTRRPGLAALIESVVKPQPCLHGSASGQCYPVTAENIAFGIGPRINAVGRVGLDPAMVVELLTAPETPEGRARGAELAHVLEVANRERKKMTDELVDKALSMADLSEPVIVVQMDIFKGYAGLVAGRLTSEFARPAIVLGLDGNGSARSIDSVDLLTVLGDYPNLVTAAGHLVAMGISNVTDATALRSALSAYPWPEGIGMRELKIDAVCTLADVDRPLVDALDRLEPMGRGNPKPLFAMGGVRVAERTTSRDGRHAFLQLEDPERPGRRVRAVWWRAADKAPLSDAIVDVVGRVSRGRDYRTGAETVEFELIAARPAAGDLPLTLTS